MDKEWVCVWRYCSCWEIVRLGGATSAADYSQGKQREFFMRKRNVIIIFMRKNVSLQQWCINKTSDDDDRQVVECSQNTHGKARL